MSTTHLAKPMIFCIPRIIRREQPQFSRNWIMYESRGNKWGGGCQIFFAYSPFKRWLSQMKGFVVEPSLCNFPRIQQSQPRQPIYKFPPPPLERASSLTVIFPTPMRGSFVCRLRIFRSKRLITGLPRPGSPRLPASTCATCPFPHRPLRVKGRRDL